MCTTCSPEQSLFLFAVSVANALKRQDAVSPQLSGFPLLWRWNSAVVDTRSPAHGHSDTHAFVTTRSEPAADNKTLRMSPVTRLKVRQRSCIRFCSRLLPMCKSPYQPSCGPSLGSSLFFSDNVSLANLPQQPNFCDFVS